MTAAELELVAHWLNRLGFVTWDRFVDVAGELAVYGWIDRDDGRSDFVILLFDRVEVGRLGAAAGDVTPAFYTSSASRSSEIAELLYGQAGEDVPCQRVEHVFTGGLVERKVVLPWLGE